MILLALAAAISPTLPIFEDRASWHVSERTKSARSESARAGDVSIRIFSRGRDGWNTFTARTTWTRGGPETVELQQNTATAELRCLSVKGPEQSYSFNPPLTIWTGAHGEGDGIRATPTLRPFGHFVSEHVFTAPAFDVESRIRHESGGRGGERDVPVLALTAETSWEAGDAYYPRKMILRCELESGWHDAEGPGFDPVRVRLCSLPSGVERLYEQSAQGEKLISETTIG